MEQDEVRALTKKAKEVGRAKGLLEALAFCHDRLRTERDKEKPRLAVMSELTDICLEFGRRIENA